MKREFLYSELSKLPKIPDKFVEFAKQIAYDPSNNPDVGDMSKELKPTAWFRDIIDLDGRNVKGRPNIRFHISQEFDDWLTKNITTNHLGGFSNVTFQNPENNGRTVPVHTDNIREYTLIYLIQQSNPDQVTRFWVEEGYPIVRGNAVFPTDWNNKTLLAEVCFKLNTWYLMKTDILHSVHNIIGGHTARLSIQVNLSGDPKSEKYWHIDDLLENSRYT